MEEEGGQSIDFRSDVGILAEFCRVEVERNGRGNADGWNSQCGNFQDVEKDDIWWWQLLKRMVELWGREEELCCGVV